MRYLATNLIIAISMSGCTAVEKVIKYNDDRYAKPGALDPEVSRNPVYVRNTVSLLEKYNISHDWTIAQSQCAYGGYFGKPAGVPLKIFDSKVKIYEESGKTWLQADESYAGINPRTGTYWRSDFDYYVRSVKYTKKDNEKEGKEIEIGLKPICSQYWWTSSHYLNLSIRRVPLSDYRALLTRQFPDGQWTTGVVNGLTWQVQETPESKLRPSKGIGGPFQSWLLSLGETGYTMALEMGASKESLQYPDAHAAIQAVFRHLIESVRVEPLRP